MERAESLEVTLEPMTRSQAAAVLHGVPPDGDRWAADYPVADELDAIRHFLARPDDLGSRRVLEKAGLRTTGRSGDLVLYEVTLGSVA